MSEYVFRDAPGFGCDMDKLMDEGGKTIGEYFASNNDDHYGTLHEEIVRCRDCAKYEVFSLLGNEVYFCKQYEADEYLPAIDPDGFCAWGVRKVDE